jgi:hypothetical protein
MRLATGFRGLYNIDLDGVLSCGKYKVLITIKKSAIGVAIATDYYYYHPSQA